MTQEERAYKVASNFYLTKEVPDEFFNWEESECYNWLEDHAWKPLQYDTGSEINELIESGASTIIVNLDYI